MVNCCRKRTSQYDTMRESTIGKRVRTDPSVECSPQGRNVDLCKMQVDLLDAVDTYDLDLINTG